MSHTQLYAVLSAAQQELGPTFERMPLIPRSLLAAGAACARALGGKTMKAILHCVYWTPRDARTPRGAAGSTRLQGTVGAAEDLSLDPEDLGEAEGVSDAPAPPPLPSTLSCRVSARLTRPFRVYHVCEVGWAGT